MRHCGNTKNLRKHFKYCYIVNGLCNKHAVQSKNKCPREMWSYLVWLYIGSKFKNQWHRTSLTHIGRNFFINLSVSVSAIPAWILLCSVRWVRRLAVWNITSCCCSSTVDVTQWNMFGDLFTPCSVLCQCFHRQCALCDPLLAPLQGVCQPQPGHGEDQVLWFRYGLHSGRWASIRPAVQPGSMT